MNCIGTYPIRSEQVNSYCGRQVVAVSHHGDILVGTLDSAHEDHLFINPYGQSTGAVSRAVNNSKVKAAKQKAKKNATKANTNVFPFGFGGGFGGGYGYGAPYYGGGAARTALAFTIPYVLLAALFVV